MAIASINPATGETLRTFTPLDADGIESVLARSVHASRINRERTFDQRATLMRRAAAVLEERREELGRVITLEMGKPLEAATSEVAKCALACRYYADEAERYLADKSVPTEALHSFIRYEPLGPVLAVMPWNFPFWQVFRFAAPALMAGNVVLLKHSSNVPQCALVIAAVFHQAGFADGEFQTLLVGSDAIPGILNDDRVKAATLTGSEAAGASVASIAAKRIKKTVLELGGSDPFIVMASADLQQAVKTGVKARIVNNGQSCIAAKRFLLHESIADEFTARFVAAMEALRLGDPMDKATDLGPLATPQILDDIEDQVRRSIAAGARLLTGGRRREGMGNFYLPTVLDSIPPRAPAAMEETFGPVASLFRVKDLEEAITLANNTSFGLGASVWTNDHAESQRFIDGLEAGLVFVNAMVASDPRMPFGGVKRSGFGRELGLFGIREFVNVKTVWIQSLGAGVNAGTASRNDPSDKTLSDNIQPR